MENSTHITGPVEEKLEKDSAHEIHDQLHPEWHRENLEVIVDKHENFAYISTMVPVARAESPSKIVLIAFNSKLRSKVVGKARERFVRPTKRRLIMSKVLTIAICS